MTDFHSHTFDWKPVISNTRHLFFHINRLESVVNELNFPLPLHRKSLCDFLYLKKGTSRRSKGLNTYEFGESSMFFLPAFQITQHEMMSADIEGFFCHFDEKIFEFLPKNYFNDNFPFFQFQSNPVIQLSIVTQNHIEAILNRLLSIYEDDKGIDKFLIASYLLALFEELRRELPFQTKKSKNAFSQITESYSTDSVKMNNGPVRPDQLYNLLMRIKNEYGNPVTIITENGAYFNNNDDAVINGKVNDRLRSDYISRHIASALQAQKDGANLKGYCVWNGWDNFEWIFGYSVRFGLIHVDFKTQERIPKQSYYTYQSILKQVMQ